MIESIGIGYSAEEEYFFNGDTPRDRCRIYHIHPLRQKELHEIDLRHPFPMVEVPTEDGIILFGIGNSIGNDQIRLFFEMAALKREIGKEYLPCVQWSFFNGKQWEFIKPGNLLSDTTGNLLNTGLVDILLPSPISEEMLDIIWRFLAFGKSILPHAKLFIHTKCLSKPSESPVRNPRRNGSPDQ